MLGWHTVVSRIDCSGLPGLIFCGTRVVLFVSGVSMSEIYAWPQKLGHELRCIMDQISQHVEGQSNGQETTSTHGSLQVPHCVGSA